MDDRQNALYERILAYPLDDPVSQFKFSDRLALENNWSNHYAMRAIREYQRFVFLALTAGHEVTPSDQVDQVWHLHLTYSRSYWQEFCPQVLGTALHHGPTRGGEAQRARFVEQYERTQASYRRLLGAEPPADIWPESAIRFGDDLHYRRVNVRRAWVVPKPRLRTRPAGVVAATAPLALGLWNPFQWNGPDFLVFFTFLVAGGVLLAAVVRHVARRPWGELPKGSDTAPLDPYQWAYLSGGRLRVLETATASMVEHGLVEASTMTRKLAVQTGTPPAAKYHPVERAVYQALANDPDGLKPAALRTGVAVELDDLRQRLVDLGLVESGRSFAAARWFPLLVLLPILALAVMRMQQGLQNDRPIGLLLVLTLILAAITCWFAGHRPRRTLAGNRRLKQLTWAGEEAGQATYVGACLDADLAMRCALFGLAAVCARSDPLAAYFAQESEAGSWVAAVGGDGGCSGGGCGGGCGGCGGCGGG